GGKMRKGQIRKSELKKRRKRREATKRLRIKYLNAKTEQERNLILQKLMKVNPYITLEQFLQTANRKLASAEQ
ncbi:MAG: DUF6800 family protein, partial [bacterium]